jgi:endothelin-converting enzyme/putative endopeptidase
MQDSKRVTPLKLALTLAFCGVAFGMAPATAQQAAPAPAAHTHAAVPLPGDDFFGHVNAEWLAKTQIPADKGSWGAGSALGDATNERIVKLIEESAAKSPGGDTRRVTDFYRSFMDEAAIEAHGLKSLKPELEKIDAIKDKAALVRALGASVRADVDPLNATNFYTENLFGIWIAQGLTDPDNYVPYILQGGLGMPDRAYYLEDNQRMHQLRTAYQAHIAAMLKLAGYSEPETRAARVFELERKLAQAHATREDSANIQKANNTWTMRDFAAKAPGMDWRAFFRAAGLNKQGKFIVYHPSAITGSAALVNELPLQSWKDFLAFHTVNHFGTYLPKAFVDQRFEFYGRTLNGTPQLSPRWKRGLNAVNQALPDAAGKMYVERYFPAEAKARLQTMVSNIVDAFRKRVNALEWMAPSTRKEALAKLDVLYVGVGYPDKWTSYEGLDIKPDDAMGNALRAEKFHYKQELAKLGKKVDPTEWCMPPHVVNAVNMPMQNALNFPAAILQPPFFDMKGSDAMNYGAIGAIIGHEISHSFDDMGAQFDSKGRLRDWWTKEDGEHFKKAAAKLVAQYDAYEAFPDLKLNGTLTLSENLADLAGLAAALDAYHVSLGGKATPGQDREFFNGYAASWANKARDASLRNQVMTDGHSPAKWRTYTVRNLDDWYTAYDVKPGQKLYLAPEQRVRVW